MKTTSIPKHLIPVSRSVFVKFFRYLIKCLAKVRLYSTTSTLLILKITGRVPLKQKRIPHMVAGKCPHIRICAVLPCNSGYIFLSITVAYTLTFPASTFL